MRAQGQAKCYGLGGEILVPKLELGVLEHSSNSQGHAPVACAETPNQLLTHINVNM
ncbi:hypothetical protein CEP51_001516 [Fusarium floridanum]|uniref:Uncharacterized protein n=1 Tax=Fusarium floridanum TaxID=1325733 RepID=A0A428SGH4_9HYPO|nr:hypothetical protein CEP51_001516 [Fusarium floridanum]